MFSLLIIRTIAIPANVTLQIKNLHGAIYTVNISPDSNISQLKLILEPISKIKIKNQRITINGKSVLERGNIYLLFEKSYETNIQVYFEQQNKWIQVQIHLVSKVHQLKKQLFKITNIEPVKQILSFGTYFQLDTNHYLNKYKIGNHSYLLLRARFQDKKQQLVTITTKTAKIQVKIDKNTTVSKLKSRLYDITQIPPQKQTLFSISLQLYSSQLLSSYNLTSIQLLESVKKSRQCVVKSYNGGVYQLTYDNSQPVYALISKLMDIIGFEFQDIQLQFLGKNLINSKLMSEYNIPDGAPIRLIGKP